MEEKRREQWLVELDIPLMVRPRRARKPSRTEQQRLEADFDAVAAEIGR